MAEKPGPHRIALTCPTFNSASCILLLVTGAEKAETLREILEGPADPPRYRVQLIGPEGGEVHWYIDEQAGRPRSRESQ